MARRPQSEPPTEQIWTPESIRAGLKKIRRRLTEVEAFDPQKVTRQLDPDVTALETSIKEMLPDVFGANSRSYRNYQAAPSLDTAGLHMNGTPLVSGKYARMCERAVPAKPPVAGTEPVTPQRRQSLTIRARDSSGIFLNPNS
jgi:hypothetical protein